MFASGIIHLLKAENENQRREHDGEQHVLPIKPLDHLAKYLFRHNPRHAEPVRQCEACCLACVPSQK